MALRIKFWGTRGSLPSAPLPSENYYHLESVLRGFFAAGYREAMQIPKFLGEEELPVIGGYGSATQCIEVDSPRAQIIIDGGSGIKDLASKIMSGGGGRV
ncbi:MAG TPA: MBL fold metallo-hydrolase, partial [Pseudobdellovibrionaceae bacterium]|nr:MBL fold metallo-hydrolase [Pseudobdellovibrionaceae bacterium]